MASDSSQRESAQKTIGALLGIHAQTPVHAGAGAALGTVDLPIQRERHTHWPTIAGSALKGILRDACRENLVSHHKVESRTRANAHDDLTAAFGPPAITKQETAITEQETAFAGAISVTDARLLAFPVRSLKGVHAWVTCSMAIERLTRDAKLAGQTINLPNTPPPSTGTVYAHEPCPCIFDDAGKKRLLLEEYDFEKVGSAPVKLADEFLNLLRPDFLSDSLKASFKSRLLVLHDDDFTHFARHATEVSARIALNYESKTVSKGALFYQEFLPAESILYAVVLARPARKSGSGKTADDVLKFVADSLPPVLQIGGDETTGKGFCAVHLQKNGGGQ